MRIVIDMQGAQSGSRFRGIGRYSLSLTRSIIRNRGEHEIILALSGLFPDTLDPLRAEFGATLPETNIRVWHGIGPTSQVNAQNNWRRSVSERCREAFLLSLKPDVLLITSLFEGLGDNAIISMGILQTGIPTAVILYDLIPLTNPDQDFKTSAIHREWYSQRLDLLRQSDLMLSISEQSRQEALNTNFFTEGQVSNISCACDSCFRHVSLSAEEKSSFLGRWGISRRFVMYTGGADERKNLFRLVESFAQLPFDVRSSHQLVLAGNLSARQVHNLRLTAESSGLCEMEVIFTGYVNDNELSKLYSTCALFVFPSLREGFGLPPLEAMSCGAAVIGADIMSLREVIGSSDALFDPESVTAMADMMRRGLTDDDFRARLLALASEQIKKFSWDDTANRAMAALKEIAINRSSKKQEPLAGSLQDELLVRRLLESIADIGIDEGWLGIVDVVNTVSRNHPDFRKAH